MSGFAYNFHASATEEYIGAYEWYEEKKEKLGDRVISAVEQRLQHICKHPNHFPKAYKNFRQAKIDSFPYVVIYEVF